MTEMLKFLLYLIVFAGLLRVFSFVLGCSPALGPEEAGAGYAAQQLACVDTYADKWNIDHCRAKVRAAWGIDAGKEAGW